MKAPHHSWIALLVIGSALAEGPPPAAPGEGGPRGQRGGGKERQGMREMMEAWKKADADRDGSISLAEFGAMERIGQLPEEKRAEIFKRFDKNGDGRIGPDEMPSRPQGGMPPLSQVDKDKDGRIVFEEFRNLSFVTRLPEDRQRELFKRMDMDGDGALTPQDRPTGGSRDGRPSGPPRDGKPGGPPRDGRRDGKGGGHGPHGPDLIKSLDRNGDGTVNFDEFRQAGFLQGKSEDEQEDRFEEMDRNGDLKIDAADFPSPGEGKPGPKGPEKD
jgi:Ca2+-binding EF-hand superfamily protein